MIDDDARAFEDEPEDGEDSLEVDSLLRKVAKLPDRVVRLPALRSPASTTHRGADLCGRTLGSFRVRELIGAGGMGVVYAADDLTLRRRVALKVLPASLVADDDRRRRFLREARSASAISHPNVATVFGAGEDSGAVFIVMEYVEGRTLRALLEERAGPLPLGRALRIARDLARGLGRAHAIGVIHRDLKPENVMITEEGAAKILDFGLAKLDPASAAGELAGGSSAELATVEGHILGTPGYMSPEQAKGKPVDVRADIFSLGVVLYEMATGARPFQGGTLIEILIATDRDAPSPPSLVNPGVPPAFDALVARCLAKRSDDRYATCEELGAALDELLGDAALEKPPSSRSTLPRSRPEQRYIETLAAPGERAVAPSSGAVSVAAAASGVSGVRAPLGSRRRKALAFAVVAAALAGAVAVVAARRDERPLEPRPAVLAARGSILACPPLAVIDGGAQDSDSAWLGAAASASACDRAMHLLGGGPARVLMPAALLDLPRIPMNSFPDDPFGASDARARSLTAARARAAAYLDGEISAGPSGFRVRLSVVEPGGAALATEEARSSIFSQAVHDAVDALARAGQIPPPASIDPPVAAWVGTQDPSALAAWNTFTEAELHDDQARSFGACGDAGALDRFGALKPFVEVECALDREPAPGKQAAAMPVDASTPGALALTSRYHIISGGRTDVRELATRLHDAREREASDLGRSILSQAESEMWQTAGELDKSRAAALLAVESAPELVFGWRKLTNASLGSPGDEVILRAFAAWRPDHSIPWRWLSQRAHDTAVDEGGLRRARDLARRAYRLTPSAPGVAVRFGESLLVSGEREEARALAARFLAAPARDREAIYAGEALMAGVEASQARFQAALRRLRRVMESHASLGGAADRFLARGFELAAILGAEAELADALFDQFWVPEPRLHRQGPTSMSALAVCMYATGDRSARCFTQVASLVERSHFVALAPSFGAALAGARLYARGDMKGAAAAWRPLLQEGSAGLLRGAMARAFDAAGEHDVAERLDQSLLDQAPLWNGATLAHVRSAQRSARRGDRARARSLAAKVLAAWLTADAPVPALAEMRRLAAR